jgi:hypothetical protein
VTDDADDCSTEEVVIECREAIKLDREVTDAEADSGSGVEVISYDTEELIDVTISVKIRLVVVAE